MKRRALVLAALCAVVSGCVSPPEAPTAPGAEPAPPIVVPAPRSHSTSPIEALEERHRARAQAYAQERNWADALVQWELLALLRPNVQEYRDAVAETRARIAKQATSLMQSAEQARKQGNLEQAELWLLRVLNVDRDNAAAAQALREIDADRTRRAYSNRPPRMRM